MRSVGSWVFALVLLVALLTPVALVQIVERDNAAPAALLPQRHAIYAARNSIELQEQIDASAVLQIPIGRPVRSTALSGLVTGVPEESRFRQGDTVLQVDGHPVPALVWPFPLYRPASSGAQGYDVAAVQQLLTTLGFYDGPIDGVYSSDLRTAIRAFELSVGRAQTGIFQPEYVLWVGPAAIQVDQFLVGVSDRVSVGTDIFREAPGEPELVIDPAVAVYGSLDGYQVLVDGNRVGVITAGLVDDLVDVEMIRQSGDDITDNDPAVDKVTEPGRSSVAS